MKVWALRIGTAVALAILALSFVNASWLAPDPPGRVKMIAHRGVYQQFDRTGVDNGTCTAGLIEEPEHQFLENTIPSITQAIARRADVIEIDIAPTSDGHLVVFHDWTLDCRTDGAGEVRDHTLEELQSLDIGYGYTADGGETYPYRGTGTGMMPSVDQLLQAFPNQPFLFHFKSNDSRQADMLAAAFRRAGREFDGFDSFYGGQAPVDRMRELAPESWAFTLAEARRCTMDYIRDSWTSWMPASCENGTIAIPLNYQWIMWGWPNRLIARAESVNARIIVFGPYRADAANEGLTEAEQLTRVPASFNGYIWVEDIWNMGPALRG